MKRKSKLALLLALVVALSVPTAFAGSFFDYGNYGGAYYEIHDSCTTSSYSSTTRCDSNTYKVYADVDVYTTSGKDTVYGQPAIRSSTTAGTKSGIITQIVCRHYIHGVNVYTKTIYV